MRAKEEQKIYQYLKDRLGSRAENRDGLIRLIKGYQDFIYVGDGCIVDYIKEHNLNKKCRVMDKTMKRFYLFYYLRYECGMKWKDIGDMFNLKHSTAIHGANTHKLLTHNNDSEYRRNTEDLRKVFVITDKRLN
tara:strand:+ start:8385 stop:8786 length:402 start_codon:yes stop_codon:yes gene_type:complete